MVIDANTRGFWGGVTWRASNWRSGSAGVNRRRQSYVDTTLLLLRPEGLLSFALWGAGCQLSAKWITPVACMKQTRNTAEHANNYSMRKQKTSPHAASRVCPAEGSSLELFILILSSGCVELTLEGERERET
eukprot:1715907-Amphidinium_carterae.2